VDAPPASGPGAQPLRVTGPNPFGEGTRFSFALDREAAVRLTVYDILGRRVRTLAAGSHPSGAHQVAWDGADEGGLPLPSGVYLVRLERGDGDPETRKVTRIRVR
jgi:flagellar hook assembly protein FlgD